MSSYQDLLAQKTALERQQADLEKQIAAAKREERSAVIAKIHQLLADNDLSLSDLAAPGKARGPKKAGTGKKVAAKYKDVATGDSWSGRGLQPKWLRNALANGRKLSDFLI
jgi:DNA-binding protein H-NS